MLLPSTHTTTPRPALTHRNVQIGRQQRRERIERHAGASSALEFFNVLTSPELLELTEAHLPEHRERLYPPTVTLAMFISQTLNADGSCQRAVNAWAVSRAAEGCSRRASAPAGTAVPERGCRCRWCKRSPARAAAR